MQFEWGHETAVAVFAAIVAIPVTLAFADPIAELLARLTFGLATTNDGPSFGGSWDAIYWRCDDSEATETRSTERLQLRQVGKIVIGRKLDERNIRLSGKIRAGKYLTGIWYDTTPRRQRFGAFQFTMQVDGNRMVGRWVGFSATRNDHMRHGEWVLERPS